MNDERGGHEHLHWPVGEYHQYRLSISFADELATTMPERRVLRPIHFPDKSLSAAARGPITKSRVMGNGAPIAALPSSAPQPRALPVAGRGPCSEPCEIQAVRSGWGGQPRRHVVLTTRLRVRVRGHALNPDLSKIAGPPFIFTRDSRKIWSCDRCFRLNKEPRQEPRGAYNRQPNRKFLLLFQFYTVKRFYFRAR